MAGKTTAGVLWAASVVSIASATNSKCIVQAENGHPAIDLNLLQSSTDYYVSAKSNSAYEYHWNVCNETNFKDSGCIDGATVCEIKDGKGLDILGFIDTMDVGWVDDNLVMSLTGQDPCPFKPSTPYSAKIYFICSQDEQKVELRQELYYQCSVELNMYTNIACGNTGHKYHCDQVLHMCTYNETGEDSNLGDCLEHCHPPPPPPPPPPAPPGEGKYSCYSNFTCLVNDRGVFSSESDCMQTCSPFEQHYSCYSGRCVRDTRGIYIGAQECAAACQQTVEKYSCGEDYTCTENDAGKFSSESDCESGCINPNGKKYACDSSTGTCIESSSGIPNEGTCNSMCEKTVERSIFRGRLV